MVGLIAHPLVFILSAAANLGNHPKNSFGCLAAAESSVLPPAGKGKSLSASYEYYVDTVEELEHSPGEEPAAAEGLPSLRIWQRRCRTFLENPPDNTFLPEGYGLILTWLRIHGAPLTPADTTLEILNKSLTRMPQSPFSRVTETYNTVYYGESPLRDDDCESLIQTLKILVQSK